MHGPETTSPALIIAIALAAGIVAQSIAQHLRVPGIVMLVATGILLGPDGVGIIDTSLLGDSVHDLVGFAIAVILFEGGLNLELRRLRREAATIRRLVSLGALITWAGSTVAARLFLGWNWDLAILFGSLVIVTGPTVITPIVRRIKLRRNLETILEAEGVFSDAVGAIIAVVALEVVLGFSGESLALGFISLPTRLVIGALAGAVGGFAIALLLRVRGVVPEGLENVFTLALAWAVFHISNAFSPESGIVAVIIAGLVVGNSRTNVKHELKEFKEQLTVMLIGMLFVLLAADVRIGEVLSLGVPGFLVVLMLMVAVRPLAVLACTVGTGHTGREKAFLSWLAPRGIVAAAVATLFYDRMNAAGMAGGEEMRALVFLVIAVTVVFQGGMAGLVARGLGVRRPSNNGYVILSANHLAMTLARLLEQNGQEVVLIDSNPEGCRVAREAGFRAFHGNGLEERILVATEMDTRRAAVAMLGNDGVNLLFARKAREEYKVPRVYVGIQRGLGTISAEMVHEEAGLVLFGVETDYTLWSVRVRRELTEVTLWRYDGVASRDESDDEAISSPAEVPGDRYGRLLPIAVAADDGTVAPFHERSGVGEGTRVFWLLFSERAEDTRVWLSGRGWTELAVEKLAPDPSS